MLGFSGGEAEIWIQYQVLNQNPNARFMQTVSKILLSGLIFAILAPIIIGLKIAQGHPDGPGVGGPIGILLMFTALAGVRAIWRYKSPQKQADDSSLPQLNKNKDV
ncbi:MAG: hypothetical protein HC913_20675 [Microscillaceae bacterium]|nr:hypothetical protein [Microscillaceae bacterium]